MADAYTMADVDNLDPVAGYYLCEADPDRLRATVAERDSLKAEVAAHVGCHTDAEYGAAVLQAQAGLDALRAQLVEARWHVAWLLPKARRFWRAHETPALEIDAAAAWLKGGGK